MNPFPYISRGYLHLDRPIGPESAERLAADPARVARHAFMPFIQYMVESRKIHKTESGAVVLKPAKLRPIAYAGHGDSHIFSNYSALLHLPYEEALKALGLNRSVTAFRAIDRQNNIHFANEVFESIRAHGACAVFATDISNYFPTIRHDRLKAGWGRLLGTDRLPDDHYQVFEAITRYAWVDREKLCALLGISPEDPREDGRRRYCSPGEFRDLVRAKGLIQVNRSGVGIPQGSPISALLSNIYLLEFDTAMQQFAVANGGQYRRYCDDILLILPSQVLRWRALRLMKRMLQDLGLVAHPDKTELINFTERDGRLVTEKPLNYLGFTFDGLFKRIRPASIARFYKKMRRGVGRIKLLRARASKKANIEKPLRLRQIYVRYSYIGKRNFISYALKAAKIMNDPGIKKQVKPHWRRLQQLLNQ